MTPEHAPISGGKPGLNPAALSVEDAAKVLSRMGGKPVTANMLEADIDAGAPTNADGSINLVHYTAWLVREMSAGGGRAD
ncbi:MAG: hypothetical protein HRT80_16675 [Henriciella sp.]|nr:hypothetical protein [Henriciella sp.]